VSEKRRGVLDLELRPQREACRRFTRFCWQGDEHIATEGGGAEANAHEKATDTRLPAMSRAAGVGEEGTAGHGDTEA